MLAGIHAADKAQHESLQGLVGGVEGKGQAIRAAGGQVFAPDLERDDPFLVQQQVHEIGLGSRKFGGVAGALVAFLLWIHKFRLCPKVVQGILLGGVGQCVASLAGTPAVFEVFITVSAKALVPEAKLFVHGAGYARAGSVAAGNRKRGRAVG